MPAAAIRDAGWVEASAPALTDKLAAWARNRGHGALVVHVPSGEARWWPYHGDDLGADVLLLRVPHGAKHDSPGDRLARCDAVVRAELRRFNARLETRQLLGL